MMLFRMTVSKENKEAQWYTCSALIRMITYVVFCVRAGEGFDKFVETVEYSLGAEDPEEFAKKEYEMQQQMAAARAKAKKKGDYELLKILRDVPYIPDQKKLILRLKLLYFIYHQMLKIYKFGLE